MLKFYYDMMSQPCRALLIFMNKTKIPFQACKIDIAKGANKTDEFKLVNPFGQVPVIDDSGFKLKESIAIFQYLCAQHEVPDHWYPKNLQKRARIDEYNSWQHAHTRFQCAVYFRHKVLLPMMTGSAPKQSSIDRCIAGMHKVFDDMDSHWLARSKYMAGDEISIADILAICEMYQPAVCGFDCFSTHPSIADWHQRVTEQLNPELDQANIILNKLTAKYKMLNPE